MLGSRSSENVGGGALPMKTAKKPCHGCPWRTDRDASDIPEFSLERAEGLAACCPDERGFGPDYFAHLFACHESRDGNEFACAGWLAVCGSAHPLVRQAVGRGALDRTRLSAGADWPELHGTYADVLQKLRDSSSDGGHA